MAGTGPKKKPTITKKISDDEFMAAAIGDVQWLKQSLKDKRGQITFDKNGLAPIHLSSIHGRLDCIRLLVENYDVDVNLPSSTGWRPIHLCISNQTGKRAYSCLTYLLEREADPSVANEDGVTPVHQAASEGHVQCLKLLLELGARIDVKDCRGNLPIDLAKLWGHRMCARILATEMWHREKDDVAKEMRQLKKVRMREVLDQLEHAEELAEEEKFYGKEAFSEWIQSTKSRAEEKLTKEKKKPVIIKKDPKHQKQPLKSSSKEAPLSLAKPNSTQRPKEVAPKPKLKDRPIDPHKVQLADRRYAPATSSLLEELTEQEKRTISEEAISATDTEKAVRPIERPPFWNEEWNKSNHAPETFNEYQPNLRDAYPRDPYSNQPHPHNSAPPELNVNCTEPLAVLEGERDQALLQSLADVKRRQVPSEESIGRPGPVVFKCKNIIDVQSKRKYDSDDLPRGEASLHLSDDVRSKLFRQSLCPGTRSKSGGCSSRLSASTALSDLSNCSERGASVDVQTTHHLFVSMAKPQHFPPLKGKEYDLNLGDVGTNTK